VNIIDKKAAMNLIRSMSDNGPILQFIDSLIVTKRLSMLVSDPYSIRIDFVRQPDVYDFSSIAKQESYQSLNKGKLSKKARRQ